MEKIFAFARFAIKPGHHDQFMEKARGSMKAAVVDLKGTHLYEWFHSPETNSSMVIEAYDGLEAVAHHGKHAGPTIPPLLEHVDSDVVMLGDVPEKMVAGMRRVFGKVSYFGARMQGRMTAAAPGKVAVQPGGKLFVVARFRIHSGKADAFRLLARQIFAVVAEREPGTVVYEWFLNADASECVVLDIYRDTDALRAHMGNVGGMMGGMRDLAVSEVELYGAIPPDMLALLSKAPATRYAGAQFQGIL